MPGSRARPPSPTRPDQVAEPPAAANLGGDGAARRPGGSLRLVEGQVRPFLASGADRAAGAADGCQFRQIVASDARLAADEEAQYRGPAEGSRRVRSVGPLTGCKLAWSDHVVIKPREIGHAAAVRCVPGLVDNGANSEP